MNYLIMLFLQWCVTLHILDIKHLKRVKSDKISISLNSFMNLLIFLFSAASDIPAFNNYFCAYIAAFFPAMKPIWEATASASPPG